ncbi:MULTISPECIES: hypothetical protein [unclassified Paenibacillus]|uniref:HicB family protein n=1 Tax=Paenibacillus provencensis TaxID=441151 RepID=A0ABW3PSC2_9BACL|nr:MULTISPECIES: hypothetical protein [unclassified Paenibacillus]MCM3128872.1 hypothetical protein [Paenibacillus sp. MER 78]SFS49647.1 hypothetical protein SAMN04488601_1011129 [Paenibacillus sp. 453mf]
MKYSINLFGYTLDCNLSFKGEELQIECTEENQKLLKNYLLRVLPRYGAEVNNELSFEELIKFAIEAEKTMDGHLSEPKIKLPYEFQPEIKQMLIEAAEKQDLSATQLLIRIIEKKYSEINEMGGEN